MKTARQIEDKLVEEGLLTAEQMAQARKESARTGETWRQVLIRQKWIDPDTLAHWLSHELQIPRVELKSYLIDSQVLDLIPEALARKHKVIPLFKVGDTLTVATADPLNLLALDELRLATGKTIETVIAKEEEIVQALEEYYGVKGRLEEVVADLTQERVASLEGKGPEERRLQGLVKEPPIIRLVNLLLTDAIHKRASDVHLEAHREGMKVRFRVDGMLREFSTLPKHLEAAVVSRIKVLANLDITERRKPQDGRFRIALEGKSIDLRVSVMPTVDGETVVLRLLDPEGMKIGLAQLGMDPDLLSRYRGLLKRAWGIILVTGPTGAGKSTTLYASLLEIYSEEKNIVTIEDPVEYRLPGIRQIQVNPAVGLTFASGLRSILRQDPDCIMVGEIRDLETAQIAIQAALTGHLVFSTLHTNDAPTALTRLVDMGIEPFLVASSLAGVVAQRLVRVICSECKEPASDQADLARRFGFQGDGNWQRGKGCRRCGQTGYYGRIGLFELMVADEEMGRLIVKKAPVEEIRAYAIQTGMRPLLKDGLMKAKDGVTTVEEVLRVTQEV